MENKTEIKTEINVLDVLTKMEEFRRTHQNEKQHPSDFCMRVLQAIVAEAAGYKSRVDWSEKLTIRETE